MSQTPAETVRQRVRELRERRGFSARQLAERCAAAGYPTIGRDLIASFESGRRRTVTIDEVLALALALDVAPVHLFVPVDDEAELELGNEILRAPVARGWVRGTRPLGSTDLRSYETEIPDSEYADIVRSRELGEMLQERLERLRE